MTNSITRRTALAIVAVGVAAVMTGRAEAADFSGKTVEIIVPAGEGGGTDLWARFYAPLLQKFLPGNPVVLVRNMPGGGHTTGGNYFAKNAQPDGLMLLSSSGTGHFNYLLRDKRVKYEFKDMRTVAAGPVGGVMYVSGKLGAKGPDDIATLQKAQLRYGSQGATSQDLLSFYALDLLGIKADAVMGMRGRSDARLAFERGDLNVDYQSSFAYDKNVKPMVESGEAVPIFTFGMVDSAGTLGRDPAFPKLPHFGEVYKKLHGKELSGIEKEVYYSFLTAGFGAQKLLSLPAATPADIVDAYEMAFTKAKQDPDFLARRDDLLGPYEQFFGKDAEAMKVIATSVSDESRAAVVKWLKERFNADVK